MSETLKHGIELAEMRRRYPLAKLIQPKTGIVQNVNFITQSIGVPLFEIGTASLGNLTFAFPHVCDLSGEDVGNRRLGGTGADIQAEVAWLRSTVEAAERYASMIYEPTDFVVATREELGAEAIDLNTLPTCSAKELSDPKCQLVTASDTEPMRWVRGISLVSGETKYVPAVLTHLYIHPWPAEQFWIPISTGVAAHTTLEAALMSAICESIERDAIALTWLAELPLPRIEFNGAESPMLAPFLERLLQSQVKQVFFDATTDLGIPTVFSVQLCPGHSACSLYVSCATSLSAAAACAKVIREAAPSCNVIVGDHAIPELIEDFTQLTDGADYYGRGGHESDFDFLLKSERRISLQQMSEGLPAEDASEKQKLNFMIGRLRQLGIEAVAVDLTTNELREVGLWVVRVVIPRLMPISFVHRARFLGTQRLLEYARTHGRPTFVPEAANPNPLPFA